ncbi:hypothetical protein GPA27_13675 [Aromatoleum toluolicum]|uniref:Transposase n=1 Tax=Aromatoleum toluolicum TaxID=90060 RepID=A0ABX1NH25_9RHOO|nr:hypothetical protein [Aromatoleum toluolicum]NMF98435.1 hypothetical protein [Aromatoleum toluolicum]
MEMPPKEVIEAAEVVGRWFAERNMTDWCLGPCASRAELENVKQVEFPRRVEKVAEGWRKKCDRLTEENARLRHAVKIAAKTFGEYAEIHAAKTPPEGLKVRRNENLRDLCREALTPNSN